MLPPETLFVDDSLANIEGAQKAGLNTLHITEKSMVEDFFKFEF
jgi:FMN phosphatase YigB (HAD superfamily)